MPALRAASATVKMLVGRPLGSVQSLASRDSQPRALSMHSRTWLRPVSTVARVGEHTVPPLWKWVNCTVCGLAARASRWGVLALPPVKPTSPRPMSSAITMTTCGPEAAADARCTAGHSSSRAAATAIPQPPSSHLVSQPP